MTAHKVSVVSTTKDSIHIQWESMPDFLHFKDIRGYRIVYQAIGSSFKQEKLTGRYVNRYDIPLLHESTFYNICVQSIVNNTHSLDDTGCVRGSTHTESLSVAIGSTFGAFLALSFIVFLVFLAKRQHTTKKQPGDKGCDAAAAAAAGVAIDEALVHMSDSLYIQLCRQRPDFAERLRELNSESGLASDVVTVGQGSSSSQRDVTSSSGGGGDGGKTECHHREPMDDGLLKPPAIPGVFVRPKLTRTRSVQDSTPDLADPTSSHTVGKPEDDVERT